MSACTRGAWCEGMALALKGVEENSTRRGLSVSRGWVREERGSRLLGVFYHRGIDDYPIVLNFCPWCAVRIRFDEPDAEHAECMPASYGPGHCAACDRERATPGAGGRSADIVVGPIEIVDRRPDAGGTGQGGET